MAGNPAVVMRLVASAYAMAEKAGAIVRRVLQSGELGIVEKTGANDLQTLADRLVQQSICASLSKSFPKITIIGEEDLPEEAIKEDLIESGQSEDILQKSCPAEYSALKEEELVVWVDPLDGTKEYTEAAKCFYLPNQMRHTGSDAQLLGTAICMVIEGGHLDWEGQEQNRWRGRVKEKCLGIKSSLFSADVTKYLYRNPALNPKTARWLGKTRKAQEET